MIWMTNASCSLGHLNTCSPVDDTIWEVLDAVVLEMEVWLYDKKPYSIPSVRGLVLSVSLLGTCSSRRTPSACYFSHHASPQ